MFQKSLMIVFCIAITGIVYSQVKKNALKKSTPVRKTTLKKTPISKNVPTRPRENGKAFKTLLFEISGKGLTKPSYLFGTMHILCADDASLSPSLKSVIKQADQVYFEIDMDNMQEIMGALKYLRMNDGKQLSDLVTAAEYEKIKGYFEKNRVMLPFSMMTRFKPYFVTSLIGEQLMTCEKKNGMETLIMGESRQYDKDIKGLETTEFQASIFDSIPYEKQADDLIKYIDSLDNYRKITQELIDVYKKQDLEGLNMLMMKSDPGMEQYMDLLLYGRNRKWTELMPGIMAGRSTLFAVGAGHLPGDQGMINLLRKSGYTLKPLSN